MTHVCHECGRLFEAKRIDAATCSVNCRVKRFRRNEVERIRREAVADYLARGKN